MILPTKSDYRMLQSLLLLELTVWSDFHNYFLALNEIQIQDKAWYKPLVKGTKQKIFWQGRLQAGIMGTAEDPTTCYMISSTED